MKKLVEVELRFQVPAEARADVTAEMARRAANLEHRTLAAIYLDTPDRRLAKAGMAWRLRREGRRWIQTLKGGGASTLERFEHEVIRPGPVHEVRAHAGTSVGDKLVAILAQAQAEGIEVGARFRTEVRRTVRRLRTRGAIVEVAFDEGRLLANDNTLRIRELEFELVSGSAVAMLALAERWRKRFGLLLEPRSKAERGDRLAEGFKTPPVRKASRVSFSRDASAMVALGIVVDECLAHVACNAIGIADGDPALCVDHVHQSRVGIRRLRSALRSFEGWAPQPPESLLAALRELFATLGASRDSAVLDSGVVQELAKVGAPKLAVTAGADGPDPMAAVCSPATQHLLLALIAWRTSQQELARQLAEASADESAGPARSGADAGAGAKNAPAAEGSVAGAVAAIEGEDASPGDVETPVKAAQPVVDARTFHQLLERRLRRWHRGIAGVAKTFDQLDETGLHELRKRIKRQRYAVEFFAPALRRRSVERYLEPLAAIQERMGLLNDLFVARARFQELVSHDPAAWFALGWLAARIAEVRAAAGPELRVLARTSPPKAG